MTSTPPAWSVPLETGVWAVLLVLLAAGIIAVALRPVLTHRAPHRHEETRMCGAPGSLGAHPLRAPAPDGSASCDCGRRRRIPAPTRTDTREVPAAGDHPDPAELARQRAGVPIEELPTDVQPTLHIVWPPAGTR